jgi:trafficking protein particle complex subunit 8
MATLPIPLINNASLVVHLHDYSPEGSAEWKELEAAFRAESLVVHGPISDKQQRQGFDLWKAKEDEDLENKERVVVVEGM